MELVLAAFGLPDQSVVTPISSGIINNTWKVNTKKGSFILQKLNDQVFSNPAAIHQNISAVAAYLKQHYPNYLFPAPILSVNGNELEYIAGEGYYRLFPFIEGSHSIDVVETPEEAFEAAAQFGQFTALLGGFDIGLLKETIPHFHDLSFRYQQFQQSMNQGNKERIQTEQDLIKRLVRFDYLVKEYESIQQNPLFKKRVTHHDTKISNVLFNDSHKAICVIDLDTLMPGYFISDVGDMIRTYICPVSENETDISKIVVRPSFYAAIVKGYAAYMHKELTSAEMAYFFYAGQFMIYMQAIRFLGDYFNNDAYYQIQYPTHNLVRAMNQTVLLEKLMEHETAFTKLVI